MLMLKLSSPVVCFFTLSDNYPNTFFRFHNGVGALASQTFGLSLLLVLMPISYMHRMRGFAVSSCEEAKEVEKLIKLIDVQVLYFC